MFSMQRNRYLSDAAQFRAFSAFTIGGNLPGALPQASTFRAFGAGTRVLIRASELLGYCRSPVDTPLHGPVKVLFPQNCHLALIVLHGTLRMRLNITDSYRQLPIIPAGLVKHARLPRAVGANLDLEFLIWSNGGLAKRTRKRYLQVQPSVTKK
jgi:hypothetical protein